MLTILGVKWYIVFNMIIMCHCESDVSCSVNELVTVFDSSPPICGEVVGVVIEGVASGIAVGGIASSAVGGVVSGTVVGGVVIVAVGGDVATVAGDVVTVVAVDMVTVVVVWLTS